MGDDSSLVSFTSYFSYRVDQIALAVGGAIFQSPAIPNLDSDADGFVPTALSFRTDRQCQSGMMIIYHSA